MSDLPYRATKVTEEQIAEEVATFWSDLRSSPERQASLRKQNIDVDALLAAGDAPITVSADSSGFDPVTTALVVSFAPVAAGLMRDVWKHILLPRILRKYGADALREIEVPHNEREGQGA